MTETRKAQWADGPRLDPGKGLFRTTLAGRGRSLREAFSNLENSHHVGRVERHLGRDLFGARVNLTAAEGAGYWEFTRVRDDIYIVVENFAYKDPRVEILPGDGLVQFYFKLDWRPDHGCCARRSVASGSSQPAHLPTASRHRNQ
jgi:hypothetical protein